MKRFYFLLLLSFFVLDMMGYDTQYRTIQVGETIIVDVGHTLTDKADISDATVVSTVPDRPNAYSGCSGKWAITGQKAGVSTIRYYLDSGSSPDIRNSYIITVVGVNNITIPQSLSLSIGENYTFSPVITDVGATTTLTWVSSNTNVATVDANGRLTATGVGTTSISCTAHNGVTARCEVTVNPVPVSKISLSESEIEMNVGSRLQFEVTVLPENVTDASVTWSSSNENVALVSESGRVIAVSPGFCQIKAIANDGSGKYASCFIDVVDGTNINYDINGNGSVDVGDVVKLANVVMGE